MKISSRNPIPYIVSITFCFISHSDECHKKWDLCLREKRTRHGVPFRSQHKTESRADNTAKNMIENVAAKSLNWNIFYQFLRRVLLLLKPVFYVFSFSFAFCERPRTNRWPKTKKRKTKTYQGEINTNTINKWQTNRRATWLSLSFVTKRLKCVKIRFSGLLLFTSPREQRLTCLLVKALAN